MSRFSNLFQEVVPAPEPVVEVAPEPVVEAVVEAAPEPVVEVAPEPVVKPKKTKTVHKTDEVQS